MPHLPQANRIRLERALTRQRNRNSRASTMISGRQYATGVDGTIIFFECERAAHTYRIDFGKRPVARRLSADGCKRMASWWSRAKGGCIGECPKCAKIAKKPKTIVDNEPPPEPFADSFTTNDACFFVEVKNPWGEATEDIEVKIDCGGMIHGDEDLIDVLIEMLEKAKVNLAARHSKLTRKAP